MPRNPRKLHHLKSSRVKIGRGVPSNSEGSSGDLTVRMTKTGVKLFAKFRDKWYIVGQGNLHQVAGDDQDQLIDDNRKKISKFDPKGKLEIKDKGALNLHPWTIKSTKFVTAFTGARKGLQIADTSKTNLFTLGEDGTIVFENTNTAYYPVFYIRNSKNQTGGPTLILEHEHPDGSQAAFQTGTIYFNGTDAGANSHTYAKIEGGVRDNTDGDERGFLRLTADGDSADIKFELNAGEDGANEASLISANLAITAAKKLYLDGGVSASGNTYLHEVSADKLDIVVGGQTILELTEGGGGASDSAAIQALNKLYFDGVGDTYISETGADVLDFYVGAVKLLSLTEAGGGASDKVSIPALTGLYFDGGGDTKIYEGSADLLGIDVGGDNLMRLKEDGDDGNSVDFRNSCAGFIQQTATFSATGVIGSGGTDDTDIDFRHGNKYYMLMTGDMTNINLIFPTISGNFQLQIRLDGDHDITNWKVYESDESAADGDTDVKWAGGSAPAISTGYDIISFYWDGTNEVAFGVGSLGFSN